MVKQGDIILIDFDPSVRHEEKKNRPAMVVSNDEFNKHCGGIVLVCPVSHAKDFPLHIDLPDGLNTDGKVLCERVRALDIHARTYRFLESAPEDFMRKISNIVKACIALE